MRQTTTKPRRPAPGPAVRAAARLVARDVMTDSPNTVRETSTLGEALDILQNLEIRHLPVVNADHEVVGMLSDRDLNGGPPAAEAVKALGVRTLRLNTPVSALMNRGVVTADPETDLRELADLLLENRIGAVPVVDPEGRLIGIVSYVDLLRAFTRTNA